MAKKIKEEIVDVVEAVEDKVEEIVEDVVARVEEVIEATSDLVEGVTVEIVNFYVRALNGIKGKVTGTDENGNTLIEIEGGTKAVFKAENLKKAE